DWAVAAALVRAGRPLVAALYAPVSDELFLSVAGQGATLNGTPIAASAGHDMAGATLSRAKRRLASPPALEPRTPPPPPRPSPPRAASLRSPCASHASRPARSTARSLPRTAAIGTLRRPIFWCTKPAGWSRRWRGKACSTIGRIRSMGHWWRLGAPATRG